ncbi:AKIP1 protein, partial [Pardalotus punctatus]|nr:AKIP1 protein [Pardalotus punctatus]
ASHIIIAVSVAFQKYYGAMVTHKCKEHEIKHFCKYHGRKAERKVDSTAEEVNDQPVMHLFFSPLSKPRRPSKDFYIEVSPGVYSVTAASEDTKQQTHIVDVNAGQSVDLTFVL